jgi:hypothetical protein
VDKSHYEPLSREYAAADPEERLRLWRSELLRLILTVPGMAALFKQLDADLAA